jgi:hypothetical protein
VGRDLHEAERLRRLLHFPVQVARSPAEGIEAARTAGVVLLEDHAWPLADEEALVELRELSAARRFSLILSRRRGEHGEQGGFAVVERPYKLDEVVDAVKLAWLRRKA